MLFSLFFSLLGSDGLHRFQRSIVEAGGKCSTGATGQRRPRYANADTGVLPATPALALMSLQHDGRRGIVLPLTKKSAHLFAIITFVGSALSF